MDSPERHRHSRSSSYQLEVPGSTDNILAALSTLGLSHNHSKLYTDLPDPRPPAPHPSQDHLLFDEGIADYTFLPHDQGGILGRGKFSAVYLGTGADGLKYAIKHTPLYGHHELIATRLLREPTILAQLPPHKNLVRVVETIRTPGHFYLVEDYLEGYITLEALAASRPNQRLSLQEGTTVLHQLVSVVRDAIHKPIQIAHRDIKPENVLIHPDTLHLILLDFGLATHYSSKEPKLTTCCGSPAFHSPELWLSLKSPPGAIRYWGPEIDIWCIGISLLRCMTGTKYPLGINHATIEHMADKVQEALTQVEDGQLRQVISLLVDMDGDARISHFRDMQLPDHAVEPALPEREFKSTTFIPCKPKHTLALPMVSPPASPLASPVIPYADAFKRSASKDRLSHLSAAFELPPCPTVEASPSVNRSSSDSGSSVPLLFFSNSADQPPKRIYSFLKYALRCAGILYHVTSREPYQIHCVAVVPQKNSAAKQRLKTLASRPSLQRTSTEPQRAASVPRQRSDSNALKKKDEPSILCQEFWISITVVPKSKKRRLPLSSQVIVQVSDTKALDIVKEAFRVGNQDTTSSPDPATPERGRFRGLPATIVTAPNSPMPMPTKSGFFDFLGMGKKSVSHQGSGGLAIPVTPL